MAPWRERLERLLLLRRKRAFRWGIGAVVVLLFVGFVVHRLSGDWRQLAATQISISPRFVVAAGALCGVNFALFLVAWQGIVTALGGSADWRGNALVYSYTYLTRFLPTPVWFLAGRWHFSEQIGLKGTPSLYATGLELGGHLVTAAGFVGALEAIRSGRWVYLALFGAVSVAVCVLGWPRLLRLPAIGRLRPRDALLWSVLYGATWVVAGPYLQAVIRAFVPSTISVWDAWRVWALAGIAGYAGFLLMGGMGFVRELSMSALLTAYLPPGDALVVAVGSRLILMVSSIAWALIVIVVVRWVRPGSGPKHGERTRGDG